MMEFLSLFAWTPFLLVFSRMLTFVTTFPLFSLTAFQARTKILFALLLTILLFPLLPYGQWNLPTEFFALAFLVAKESLVGFLMGFITGMIFRTVEFMGELIGYQAGFSFSRVVDPTSGEQTSLLSLFATFYYMAIFLALDGHYYLIWGMKESFFFISPGASTITAPTIKLLSSLLTEMFVTAIRIGAPALVSLIFVDITLSLMGRVAPKLQIFALSFPVKIGIALISFAALLSLSVPLWERMTHSIPSLLSRFFETVK